MKTNDFETQKYWLGKLANLNPDKKPTIGIAPHKPLMLFTVIDLIEQGKLRDGWIPYNADLVTAFRNYWHHVHERRRNQPDITMPFNALGSDRDPLWERFDENGNPSISRLTTRLCKMDPGLHACLMDPEFRTQARRILIATYFPPNEQTSLCSHFRLPPPDTAEMLAFKQDKEAFAKQEKKGRDSRFRSEVGTGYRYTCSLTGYRLECIVGYFAQACHIHERARSGNNDPTNGLALTPDAHWMFDKGLWTAVPKGDDWLIMVAKGRFTESPGFIRLMPLDGRACHFADFSRIRPDPAHFLWHFSSKFLG